MNQASRTVPVVISWPCTTSAPSGATCAVHGSGRGVAASVRANSGASPEGVGIGAGIPAGRSRLKLWSYGTHTRAHTRKLACSVTDVAPVAPVRLTGSSTVPE